MPKTDKEKQAIEQKKQRLIQLTEAFCDESLDDEYKQLCEKLILKMSRKRSVPFLTGRIEIWAAAIVYALGSINFLFDSSFEPYASADDICDFFGTNKSTTSQKAKLIKDMFKMQYWDEEFSTAEVKEHDPFAKMVMINGLIVPIDSLPPEIREIIEQERKK